MSSPRLYGELAEWYYHLTHPDDYEEEAGVFHGVFQEHARIPVRRILELGSGGGANALYLKQHYEMTLTDLSERMLAQSKTINADCRHVVGDMRTMRLDEEFDAVFLHDAVAYMTTEEDLGAAIATAAAHLRPGGMALFVPDDLTERYKPSTSDGGHEFGGRSLRYTESHGPLEPGSTVVEVRFRYELHEADGTVRIEDDVHLTGVFPEARWLSLMRAASLEPLVLPYEHSEFDEPMKMFVGFRPA